MKRITPFIALLALVALAGCSGDSPSAKPVPTVVPTAWAVESLTASASEASLGSVVPIEIRISKDGSPAPNGTSVELKSTGPGLNFGFTTGYLTKSESKGTIVLQQDVTLVVNNGTATVFFFADWDSRDALNNPIPQTNENPAGPYTIQARVENSSPRQIVVTYRDSIVDEDDELVLLSVNPDRGPYSGNQAVTIYGRNIKAPAEVFFIVENRPFEANVENVEEGDQSGNDSWVTVTTPEFFVDEDRSINRVADIRVTSGLGTENEQIARLDQAYTLLAEDPVVPNPPPVIYGVSPNSGRSMGGETVTIFGRNFGSAASELSVVFTGPSGSDRPATVESVAPDGSEIRVETPRFSTVPLTEDQPQDVTVTTVDGDATLEDAFIVIADNPTPEIASISPVSGPIDGGTLVTIFGSGFQAPMQVFFGNLTAIDVNVLNDTTPADQDRITCVSPDYSTQGDVPPVAVPVRVVNMTSGLQATLSGGFTYGDNLYISGNSPVSGGRGTLLVIYGSGFEDPLQVDLLCVDDCGIEFRLEVLSVSGTEIVARIPQNTPVVCESLDVDIQVTLLESNLSTIGGEFRYLGSTPRVYSVSPVILVEQNPLAGNSGSLVPNDISIEGQFFFQDPVVEVGLYSVPSANIDVNADGTRIDVQNLPIRDSILVRFDEVACVDINGNVGLRNTTTPVDITVTNLPGECSETVMGAIAIEPYDTDTCRIAPNISVSFAGTFAATSAGSCSPGQPLVITNTAAGSSLTGSVDITGPFYFTQTPGGGGSQSVSFPNIPGNANLSLDVFFCPDQATGGAQSGTMTILSNDPDSPVINRALTGTEGTPP